MSEIHECFVKAGLIHGWEKVACAILVIPHFRTSNLSIYTASMCLAPVSMVFIQPLYLAPAGMAYVWY